MTDYIKREDALNMVRNTFTGMTADTLELRIDDIPSSDVAPVRHGRWAEKTCVGWAGGGYWRCSCCGFCYSFGAYHEMNESNYCPNCGAKMDEEETKE